MLQSQIRSSQRGTVKLVILALLALAWPTFARAQGTIIPFSPQYFTDTNGLPCSGCKLYTYAAGTTTPQATYTVVTLTVGMENANPVVISSGGWPTTGYIYLSATSYKFVLTTSADVTIWTRDNQTSIPTTSGNTDITGTAGEALAAGDLAYLSDGSGSLTAGRWYKADADFFYGSIHPTLGFVPTAIAGAATGSIRTAGTVTLSGLTAGSTYYVSGTAGGLTATAPANVRRVGQAISTTSLVVDFGPAWILDAGQALNEMGGRLTLTTAVPVTTADVTAAGTIYYTPYKGNRVTLFDGTRWKTYSFSELSLALTCTASKPYDVWLYDNAGTLTLETLVWTNDTTRATALVLQNGVFVKTGATTRRYVGSFYCDSGGNTTTDSLTKRSLYNYYNRVRRAMQKSDANATWNYTIATLRQARADATNQLDFIVGVAEDEVFADLRTSFKSDGATRFVNVGIGLDSTTAFATGNISPVTQAQVAATWTPATATYRGFPAAGRHTLVWLEASEAVGTTTWGGNPTANGFATISAISGDIWD